MIGDGCVQGGVELSVELFKGEFVGVLKFLFVTVHDTFFTLSGVFILYGGSVKFVQFMM